MIISRIVKKYIQSVKPSEKYIWFESNENFFDNSYALYLYIKENFKRYHLLYRCFYFDKLTNKKLIKKKQIKRRQIIYYDPKKNNVLNKIRYAKYKYYTRKCGLIFISYNTFDFQYQNLKNQKVVNLWHANLGFKNGSGMDYLLPYPKNYYYVSPTKESYRLEKIINANLNDVPQILAGKPRNDFIFNSNIKLISDFLNLDLINQKFILVCCTFKTFQRTISSDNYLKHESPFNFNLKEFEDLNSFLKQINMFIVIKSHHVQDKIKGCPFSQYSNFIFKSQEDFEENNLHINHLFNFSSGLITDISSIYFDYLLVNKPIGFYDFYLEDYKKEGRLTSNDLLKLRYGYSIKSYDDLVSFLNQVNKGINIFSKKQKDLSIKINGDYKSNNCLSVCRLLNIK